MHLHTCKTVNANSAVVSQVRLQFFGHTDTLSHSLKVTNNFLTLAVLLAANLESGKDAALSQSPCLIQLLGLQ